MSDVANLQDRVAELEAEVARLREENERLKNPPATPVFTEAPE